MKTTLAGSGGAVVALLSPDGFIALAVMLLALAAGVLGVSIWVLRGVEPNGRAQVITGWLAACRKHPPDTRSDQGKEQG